MKGRFNFSELYRTLIFMAWRFNFMKQNFNVEKLKNIGEKFFAQGIFQKKGVPPMEKSKK